MAASRRRRHVATRPFPLLTISPPNGLWLAQVRFRKMADVRLLLPALAKTYWPVEIEPIDGLSLTPVGRLYRLNEYLMFGQWYVRWDYNEEAPDGEIGRDFHHVLRGVLVVLSGGSTGIVIERFFASRGNPPTLVPGWPYMSLVVRPNGHPWPRAVDRLTRRKTWPRIDGRSARWLKLAVGRDGDAKDIREALQILGEGQPGCDWVGLWKVYEIIRHSIRPESMTQRQWVTVESRDAFANSANHPEASGTLARHARRPEPPPTVTMTLPEAQRWIAELTRTWLDALWLERHGENLR